MNERDELTRTRLLAHAAAYPCAQVQDYMKYLYQSALGGEHLMADEAAAADYIRREAETARPRQGEWLEPLDGDYCRVHLDVLNAGLSPETFAALFALSSAPQPEGETLLAQKIAVLRAMTAAGELPLDAGETEEALAAWKAAGYPACHHSQAFREAYAPAYRLIRSELAMLLPLFICIDWEIEAQGTSFIKPDSDEMADLLARFYDCEPRDGGVCLRARNNRG